MHLGACRLPGFKFGPTALYQLALASAPVSLLENICHLGSSGPPEEKRYILLGFMANQQDPGRRKKQYSMQYATEQPSNCFFAHETQAPALEGASLFSLIGLVHGMAGMQVDAGKKRSMLVFWFLQSVGARLQNRT